MPIMTRYNERVLYIDGFAGPGIYEDGEAGSPLTAIDAALNHKTSIDSEIDFWFIEDDPRRAQKLEPLVSERNLPPNFKLQVFNAKFDDKIT